MRAVSRRVIGIICTILLFLCLIDTSPAKSQTHRRGCGENLNQEGLELETKAGQLFQDGLQENNAANAAKLREAIRLYKEVLKVEPRLHSPYVNLSIYYDRGEKNPEKALSFLKNGLSQCPEEPNL